MTGQAQFIDDTSAGGVQSRSDTRTGARGEPRLLLLSYHFPPSTAIGALRWEKLALAAVERGYKVDVLTLHPAQLASTDESRLRALPDAIRLFPVHHERPVETRFWDTIARATQRLRAESEPVKFEPVPNAPDASGPVNGSPRQPWWDTGAMRRTVNAHLSARGDLSWARAATRRAMKLSRIHDYCAVITSGPPHYVHVAGTWLTERTRIPHVADFRDPWGLVEFVAGDLQGPTFLALARKFEARMVKHAGLVVMNTEAAAEAMRVVHPAAADRIMSVMNGSDPEDRVESPSRSQFTVLYAGSLYLQRDPRVLFRACAPLVAEKQLTPQQFSIQFLGHVTGYEGQTLESIASEFGLQDHLVVGGLVKRSEALAAAARATVLVCLPDSQLLTIPAKLFEYVQLDAWLLAFAAPGSAMARVLQGTDADVIAPGDTASAADAMRRRWASFRDGLRPAAVGRDGRFLRATQAQLLFDRLAAMRARAGCPTGV